MSNNNKGTNDDGNNTSNNKQSFESTELQLPRWANYQPYCNSNNTDLKQQQKNNCYDAFGDTIKDEEDVSREDVYLREKAFLYSSNILKDALASTFDDTLRKHDNLLQQLISFFIQFQPQFKEENDCNNLKKTKYEKEEEISKELLQSWILTSTRSHDPTILPLAIMHCAPSVLDRIELIKSLSRAFRYFPSNVTDTTKSRKRQRHDEVAQQQQQFALKPAICIIEHQNENFSSGKIKMKNLRDYLYDILVQCINQEHDPSKYKYLLDEQYSSTKSSTTIKTSMLFKDRLVEWCSLTTCFNSILLIVKNPEIMPLSSIDSLTGTMSMLRSHSGVPISLILISISKNLLECNKLSILNSLDGQVGAEVCHFHTASSGDMLDCLLNKLYLNIDGPYNLPILLSNSIIRKIHASFHDNHGSIVSFVQEMRMALAHHFCKEGTFLALAHNNSFMNQFGQRVAWFCVTKTKPEKRIKFNILRSVNNDNNNSNGIDRIIVTSEGILKILQTAIEERTIISLVSNLIDIAYQIFPEKEESKFIKLQQHQSPLGINNKVEQYITMCSKYKDSVRYIFENFRTREITNLVRLFFEWRIAADRHIDSCQKMDVTKVLCCHIGYEDKEDSIMKDAFKEIENLRQYLNESIILLGALYEGKGEGVNLEREFRESLVEKFKEVFGRRIPFSVCIAVFGGNNNNKKSITSFLDSLHAEPRRRITDAITNPVLHGNCVRDHAVDVQTAFKCFKTRIISKDDWFQLFVTSSPDLNSEIVSNEHLQRFALAVYELVLCALVTRGKYRLDSFEKRAMVWASGN